MRTMVARPAVAGLLTSIVLALSGCSFTGLSLVVDERLTFVTPADREAVELPVTITWEIDDFRIIANGEEADASARSDAGYFGVFIDATPQPPGEDLLWFAEDDDTCKRDPACPDEDYFTVRGIHTTSDTSFTITRLPRPIDSNRRELHEVTVVLLDPDGVRIGESAWTIEFEVVRSDS